MGAAEPVPERYVRYRWAGEALADGRVLDAGCGAGWGTAMLAGSAAEAVGVDYSPPMIRLARMEYGERAEFVEGDLRQLPFEQDEFDHVVCFETLAHIAEPELAVDELQRVLRPGGLALVSAPNPTAYPNGNPLHLSEIAPKRLSSLLEARFANVALYAQHTYFASLLGPAGLLAHADPAAEISPRLTKLSGGPPGSELHAVAVASDGELPAEPAWLSLGEGVDYATQRRSLREWQQRAVRAEAEACALQRKLRELGAERRPGSSQS